MYKWDSYSDSEGKELACKIDNIGGSSGSPEALIPAARLVPSTNKLASVSIHVGTTAPDQAARG